ncbi:hypothetical protein ACFSUS_06255 [Spirosoma soli]|uniref:Lipoprotein n=1 Tax=Spirosoma soli TaxID=1770529 RepID=A0ABW5M102_9BACT
MRLLTCLILAVLLGCQSEKFTQGPEQEILAVITGNSLPVDGCEESVRIDSVNNGATSTVRYKPTASSLPILQGALNSVPADQRYAAEIPVLIRFYKTGRQVELECGWGSRPKVDEIEILKITQR